MAHSEPGYASDDAHIIPAQHRTPLVRVVSTCMNDGCLHKHTPAACINGAVRMCTYHSHGTIRFTPPPPDLQARKAGDRYSRELFIIFLSPISSGTLSAEASWSLDLRNYVVFFKHSHSTFNNWNRPTLRICLAYRQHKHIFCHLIISYN